MEMEYIMWRTRLHWNVLYERFLFYLKSRLVLFVQLNHIFLNIRRKPARTWRMSEVFYKYS